MQIDLDSLLWIENQFYHDGYQQGFRDGIVRARIEGRIEGIEKGYNTMFHIGRIYGRSDIWKWTICNQPRIIQQLLQLEERLNKLISIQTSSPILFKSLWNKSKAKFKTIAHLMNEESLIETSDTEDMENTPFINDHNA
ncbi:hypothetical protein T552_01077 [Pneumocystis carinii B80]|uniref:Essential protein Yae1 N-terminal domain-containing protein n=1 Tax=Pneumocystis carinii (strain B80) TaxID=1408658 RepID=A0A0W4ZND9_PNEC8|nr:hypothetical protein T552_01077 [Pneumocystis carinii B80]KTW29873.1 hypothetical protein T552_01077 [Pneumocystis carinii B80]